MDISLYQIISFSIILLFSLILSVQDARRMEVKVYIQWLAIFCALVCHLIFARSEIWIYILSGILMGAFYFAVRKITKNKLGTADVWFGIFQGLFLTPFLIPVCLGAEVVAVLIIVNKRFGHQRFAFIPYMSFGLIISYLLQAAGFIKY